VSRHVLKTTAICKTCSVEKPIEDFPKRRRVCKACCCQYGAAWRTQNKDRVKSNSLSYRERNKDVIRDKRKQWYETHKNDVLKERSTYYSKKSASIKARVTRYSKEHPERIAVVRHRRRARMKGSGGFYTEADVGRLLEQQEGLCANLRCCADLDSGYHIDHIVPICLGGSSWPDNIQLLCPKCNLSKGAKHPDIWRIRKADDPYWIVSVFERAVAKYAGAPYAVAVESCSAALFLSCLRREVQTVTIPSHTYPSVPAAIIHAGGKVIFSDVLWEGVYELAPYNIWDGALRFSPNMYKGGFHCLSFHIKKAVPIGRGGMILCDSLDDVMWFKKMRFDGRDETSLDKEPTMVGWNFYMETSQAARGLELLAVIKNRPVPDLDVTAQGYPDLSLCGCYK
jgi:5-methylcytosine-specific restriction endonuclease McrA